MRRRSRRNRRSGYTRRRRHNWAPFIGLVLVLSFFLWALFQFFSLLFDNVNTQISSAQLEILQGRGEFRLSNENSNWTPAFSGQNFVEGDQLQTARNAYLKLTFFDQHNLFLNEETKLELLKLERKSSGKIIAHWRLDEGEIWAQIDNTAWAQAEEKPDIKIYTPRSIVNVTGTTFNLKVGEDRDNLKLIKGGVQLDLQGETGEIQERVTVSVGQQITVDSSTMNLVEPASALEIIDPEFLESDWHLKNLANFEPDKVAETRAKIEARNAPPETETPEENETTDTEFQSKSPLNPELEAPVILSPAQDAVIPASQNSIAIEGTAPEQAFQIQVNGYTLSKFQPGDRKWTYFAATKFNTLQPGDNLYQIITIDRQGQRSPVTELRLNYEGTTPQAVPTPEIQPETPTSEAPDDDLETSLDAFPPPVVTTPELFAADPTATYQTSADRVTLFGEVPVGTNAVKVNNFKLRQFKPGDTKFKYTAIALGVNGNMKAGENVYTIQALGPDGKSSETKATVFYSPLNLEE